MTKRLGETDPYFLSAWQAAKRFDADVHRFSMQVRELATRRASINAELTALRVPESTIERLDEWDAQLAFAEAELREMTDAFAAAVGRFGLERAKSRTFFDASGPSIVTDRSGVIDELNAGAAGLFSVWPEAMHGKPLIALVARQDTRAFRSWFRTLDARPEPQGVEMRLRPRGGAPFRATLGVRFVPGPVDATSALYWTIRPLPALVPESLQSRVLRAIEDLRSSIAAVQASAQRLRERAKVASDHTEIVDALAAAVALPIKPLDDLERLAEEVIDDNPRRSGIRFSS